MIPLAGCPIDRCEDWLHAPGAEPAAKKAKVDSGKRAGIPTVMAVRVKALERENRELRQANDTLRKATHAIRRPHIPRIHLLNLSIGARSIILDLIHKMPRLNT